jgi:putative ABC transport system substrate-binding protein
MDRRHALSLLAAGLLPLSSRAQERRVFRVAYLSPGLLAPEQSSTQDGYFDAVLRQLETHGFVRGRNLETRIFYRRTDVPGGWSGPWRRQLVDEAVAWRPDVIAIAGADFARIARQARIPMPAVFGLVQDPVSEGIVERLGRPEGNITGAGIDYYTIALKRIELARELLPALKRMAVIVDSRAGGIPRPVWDRFVAATRSAAITAVEIDVAKVDGGLCSAGKHANNLRAEVILTLGNIGPPNDDRSPKSWVQGYGDCLYELQKRSRLPVIDDSSDTVSQGVVAAIGEDTFESFRRAGDLMARILNGAKPADIPVDMQMRVQLVLNARTAREIDLVFPRAVVTRADRVLE